MNLSDLQQYIRFNIDQLSTTNGSADFEKICLYYSRFRIHRNILPATGPVQAGGDQGRDFETFHTYLSDSEISKSSFVADDSAGPVVFACSLQKDPTKKNGKIVSDVRVITKGGAKVERIYFFSGRDIPVAARHKVQDYVHKEFAVSLEIIDAQALAMHLCDPDLFWIAAEFLKVSSELFPERTEQDWYQKLKKEYQGRKTQVYTFQEFEEVKGAIRHIYKNGKLKSDLTFWYRKLDELISNPASNTHLMRKAIYEKFVTSLIGLDFVEGQEENIKKYFIDFEYHIAIPELVDAQILLSFCHNSAYMTRHKLSSDFFDGVSDRMEHLLISQIANSENSDNKAMLLEIYANFTLHDWRDDKDVITNYGNFIQRLHELQDCLEETHFYPINKLSDRLNGYISKFLPLSFDIGELEKVAADVEDFYQKKAGMAAAAMKLRDRAMIYMKSGDYVRAIKLLHELKLKWFNKNTEEGMILSCLLLADAYYNMSMFLAAKYFALLGVYTAYKSHETTLSDKVPMGIAMALNCEYTRGAWLSYLRLVPILFSAHHITTKDFNLYKNDDTNRLLYHPAIIFETARRYVPEAVPLLDEETQVLERVRNHIQSVQDDLKGNYDDNHFKEKLDKEVAGTPFLDLGVYQEIIFNAFGCDWYFSFENNLSTTVIAEEFICTFQILIVELAGTDLNLLPGKVKIRLAVAASAALMEEVVVEDGTELLVNVPRFVEKTFSDRHKFIFEQIVLAQALIYQRSMLSKESFKTLLGPIMEDQGIISKVSFGQSYDRVVGEFYFRAWADQCQMEGVWSPFNPNDIPENLYLPARKGLSMFYNSADAMERIKNRISNLQNPLSVSLPILLTKQWFRNIIFELRDEGWLDWQILHSLGHLVVNYKMNAIADVGTINDETQLQLHLELFSRDERDWYWEINERIITKEELVTKLEFVLPIAVLASFGLENKSLQPEVDLIKRFLKDRFRFFLDGKDIKLFDISK